MIRWYGMSSKSSQIGLFLFAITALSVCFETTLVTSQIPVTCAPGETKVSTPFHYIPLVPNEDRCITVRRECAAKCELQGRNVTYNGCTFVISQPSNWACVGCCREATSPPPPSPPPPSPPLPPPKMECESGERYISVYSSNTDDCINCANWCKANCTTIVTGISCTPDNSHPTGTRTKWCQCCCSPPPPPPPPSPSPPPPSPPPPPPSPPPPSPPRPPPPSPPPPSPSPPSPPPPPPSPSPPPPSPRPPPPKDPRDACTAKDVISRSGEVKSCDVCTEENCARKCEDDGYIYEIDMCYPFTAEKFCSCCCKSKSSLLSSSLSNTAAA
ncbi:hypothetical protein MKW92_014388 [Papaver armeniacum]|nr:hypothetical protein MKW92_014388 [Papaver armeniacum]